MRRRAIIAGLAGALAPLRLTQAQQAVKKIPIIGFLHPGFPDASSLIFDGLRSSLGELGYIEGQTIVIETRWAHGKPETLPQLARDLVHLRVGVLVATARAAIEAARAATTDVPIIGNDLESDPVASGYAASLSRPGGNLTGLFLDAPSLCGKWLQQIGEIVPRIKKIAVLWDSTTGTYQLDAITAEAKINATEIVIMAFRDAAGIEKSLEIGLAQGPQAVIQLGSPVIRQAGRRIAEVLLTRQMPGISQFRTFTDAGGLISYGPDLTDLYRRIGPYVARILRGARPGELPIERPTKFELVVNLAAAKSLGLTIPNALIATADDVIE
jgi:putative ABC transport system substrate-binding protein